MSTVVHTSTTPAVPTLASPLYQHLWMDCMSNDTQLWCSSITCRVHFFCFVLLSGGAKSLLCAFCGVVMCAHVSQQAAVPPHPTSLYLHCQTHTACHICQTRKSLCICPNPVRPYTVCSLKWRGLGPVSACITTCTQNERRHVLARCCLLMAAWLCRSWLPPACTATL